MERPTIFGVFTGKLGKSEGYDLPITSSVWFYDEESEVLEKIQILLTMYEVKHTTFHFYIKFVYHFALSTLEI